MLQSRKRKLDSIFTIYFKNRGDEKHEVFVHISNGELIRKFNGDALRLLKFYWSVMRAPLVRGVGNYPLEEKLANTLLLRIHELDNPGPNFDAPLTPGGDLDDSL